MQWLKRIFGKDERFFDLLEAGAEEVKASVAFFSQYLNAQAAGGSAGRLDELVQTRRKEKRIRQEMTEALSRTFVTPLDREDIEALSFALYRVPKQIEKTVERMSICPGALPHAGFRRQAELLLQASEAVVFMGMGATFQIWEPAAAERRRAEARIRARDLAPPRVPPRALPRADTP